MYNFGRLRRLTGCDCFKSIMMADHDANAVTHLRRLYLSQSPTYFSEVGRLARSTVTTSERNERFLNHPQFENRLIFPVQLVRPTLFVSLRRASLRVLLMFFSVR